MFTALDPVFLYMKCPQPPTHLIFWGLITKRFLRKLLQIVLSVPDQFPGTFCKSTWEQNAKQLSLSIYVYSTPGRNISAPRYTSSGRGQLSRIFSRSSRNSRPIEPNLYMTLYIHAGETTRPQRQRAETYPNTGAKHYTASIKQIKHHCQYVPRSPQPQPRGD